MEGFGMQLAGTLLALAAVGVLAWASIALLKRIQEARSGQGGPRAQPPLRFVRAMPVGPKERVVVIHHRGEELLLGVSPGGITLLTRQALPGEQAEEDGPG